MEDPNWAQDFAPNGSFAQTLTCHTFAYEYTGSLLQVGEIMTRKRYAKYVCFFHAFLLKTNTFVPALWTRLQIKAPRSFTPANSVRYSLLTCVSKCYQANTHLAETLVNYIQQTNGTLTLSDFKNYKVISRPVKNVTYRGLHLYTIGTPASGSITLNILKIMEQFDVADSKDTNLTSHRFVEAMRFGYGARAELGDPAFVEGLDEYEAHLLDEVHAKQIRERISDKQTLPVREYNPKGVALPESHGTSHIVTADRSGMATSLTTTVNLLFGAQIMDPSSGIILYVLPFFLHVSWPPITRQSNILIETTK